MPLLNEIHEQPDAVSRAISSNRECFESVARMAAGCNHIVIAARGSSDNAARYAQYVWGARNGFTVSLSTPSLFSLYRRPPSLDGALVVGISQSGQSPDIVSVIEGANSQGRPTVAITNDTGSPLAEASDIVVSLHAGEETAVAATKTYTSELAVIAGISEALLGNSSTLDHLGEMVGTALGLENEARETAHDMGDFEHAAILGRGFNLSTAFEWALKMQELSYVVAQPFSTADFLHGPIAVIDRGYPVLAVVAEGRTHNDLLAALDQSRERGAPTVVITDSGTEIRGNVLRLPGGGAEWLTPLPAIAVAQLFTYWSTRKQGHDPDSPRGLDKVTRTT